MGRLQDKVAIITGAGNGMGAAGAARFASEGASVVVADNDADAARTVADAITGEGGRAVAVEVDVRDAGAVDAMVDTAVSTWGTLDVLYNNAGISPAGDGDATETTSR